MIKRKKILFSILIIMIGFLIVFAVVIGRNYKQGKETISKNLLEQENGAYETISYQGREYTYKENLVNILCMGIDKEEKMNVRNDADNSVGQADAIFLMSLDLEKNEIRLITLPRDTMVMLELYHASGVYLGSYPGQIALQYAYGDGMYQSADLMMKQVSNLFHNIPINAYAAINVYTLWNLNEAVGGVDMTMDEDYTMFHPELKKGETVHLTGNLMENYIRGRDKMERGSAYSRNHRLKQYMLAFFEAAKKELRTDITLPFRCLDALKENMVTNVTKDEIVYLVSEVLGCSFLEENIYTIPGEQILGEQYEEFYINEAALDEFVVELFYE